MCKKIVHRRHYIDEGTLNLIRLGSYTIMDILRELEKQWEATHGMTPTVEELIDAAKKRSSSTGDADNTTPEQNPLELIKQI